MKSIFDEQLKTAASITEMAALFHVQFFSCDALREVYSTPKKQVERCQCCL